MRIGWIGGGLWVISVLVSWGRSSNVMGEDAAHRAALETRLRALQVKKAQLEEVPGSLEQQRHYQARIDVLNTRLGYPTAPFAEDPKAPQEKLHSSVPAPSEENHDEVDFFHDRSQVVEVNHAIEAHGGIHPHSSLSENLPRTHPPLHGNGAPPLRRGVIIDGGENPTGPEGRGMPTPPQADLEKHKMEQEGATPPPGGAPIGTKIPDSQRDTMSSQGSSPLPVPSPAPGSEQQLALPQTGMPPAVWTQTKSHQDYSNKAGWSVAPPPIISPLFSGPPLGSAALVEAAAQQSIQQENARLSFSPKRLLHLWPQG
jgi:hypothetical protein